MVSQQMAMMEPIYVLFEQQLASREVWGETLWKDLNVQILQEGIDGYLSKARKLPKAIRAQPVRRSILVTFARHLGQPPSPSCLNTGYNVQILPSIFYAFANSSRRGSTASYGLSVGLLSVYVHCLLTPSCVTRYLCT